MIQHQVTNSLGNYNYNAYIYCNALWEPHFHGNYELMYVFEGKVNITLNGVPDTLCEGELILVPPYTVHALEVNNAKTWVGVFSEDYIEAYAKKYKYVRYSKFRCRQEIESILKQNLFFEGTPERFLGISCLYMVCNECLKNATVYQGEQNDTFIADVVTYISQNVSYEVSLKEIAEHLNYEYHYFSALFHKYFSINFKEFVNLFRFEKACSLLQKKENSIAFVAQSCGFGSIRNFNRVFKHLSGYTPNEYRKQPQKA